MGKEILIIAIGNIVNISEQPFVTNELTMSHLLWQPCTNNLFVINNACNNETSHSDRIKLLNASIKTKHMNNEEKVNIINICNEYFDIIYLEGDSLKATDIVNQKINTPRIKKAINIRPSISNPMGLSRKNKKHYDKKTHNIDLQVGNIVLIKEHNKGNTPSRNWTRPYEVLELHENENITVNKDRKDYRIHKNNVKLFYEA